METESLLSKKDFLLKSAKSFRPIDIVVILSTIVALHLFRLPDGHQLNPIWQLKQSSNNQHLMHAQPLITDIDGNGLKELIIASEDRIEIFSYHESEFEEASTEHVMAEDQTIQGVLHHLHSRKEIKYSEIIGTDEVTKYPVVMNAGCITMPHHKLCVQSLAVVWSDWTITLLSDQLKVLWKSRPLKIPAFPHKLRITEMSALVVHRNNSLFGENGLVIVGGVLNLKEHYKLIDLPGHDHSRPTVPSETPDEISEQKAGIEPKKHGLSHDLDPESAKYLGHFTTYVLDGKTGELKWKHEPGDFEAQRVTDEEKQSHLHFKLRLRKKRLHTGEVHWKKFTSSFFDHLPYAWQHHTDTDIALGNFKRTSTSKASEPNVYGIPEQIRALFKTTKIPKEGKGDDSNVVVLRHRHAIEVLDLGNGNPVCTLPLDGTKRSAIGGVIGDGIINSVRTFVHEDSSSSGPTCFLVASSALVRSSVHFNSSVCHPLSIYSFFGENDASIPFDGKLGILAPLLVKPVERASSLSEHFWGYGLSRIQVGLDSFVLLSSGKLAAFGPSGRFLWQVDTNIAWSENYVETFYPSMKPVSLNFEGIEDAVVILGPRDIIVVSLVDGSILSTHSLPCLPAQPLVSGDINNDGTDELLVRCEDRLVHSVWLRR